jgi:hypothetical protein
MKFLFIRIEVALDKNIRMDYVDGVLLEQHQIETIWICVSFSTK